MSQNLKKKLVVAGHICLDITPAFPECNINRIDQILIPGRIIRMGSADIHTGGCVTNTGLAMKILGADVQLMGKVGKDAFGEIVLSLLEPYQVADSMIIDSDSDTSYSVVLAPGGLDRVFLHHPGANNTFSMEDLDFSIIKDASIFHFGYPPVMEKMYENNGEQLIAMFKKVKSLGVATSLDMASVDENSPCGLLDWKSIIKELIPYVDFFLPSVEELAYMIDRERYLEWQERAQGKDITSILSIEKDIRPLADQLLSWGAKVVLIKCGAPGLYLRCNQEKDLETIGGDLGDYMKQWADVEHFEKSYKPSRVLSGTGAGDTSIAAFLTSISESYPWEECLKLATATGASCVTAYDSLSGIKPFPQLIEEIEKGWEKID